MPSADGSSHRCGAERAHKASMRVADADLAVSPKEMDQLAEVDARAGVRWRWRDAKRKVDQQLHAAAEEEAAAVADAAAEQEREPEGAPDEAEVSAQAARIQSIWRGCVARRHTKLLSLWWDAVIEEDAATRIQAAYRGRMHRARSLVGVAALLSVGGDRTAAENDHTVEHSSRASSSAASSSASSSVLWEDLIVTHAATVIQSWFRGWRWRKRVGA